MYQAGSQVVEGYRRLRAGAVLVAGLGPAGSAAAMHLGAAGVGRLTLWDPGVVAATDRRWAGQPKARVAASPLRAALPETRIDVLDGESDVVGALPEHHLLLASAGPWAELGAAAQRSGTAVLYFGAHGYVGGVTMVRPGGPCLCCLGKGRAAAAGLVQGEGGGAAAVVGALAAAEAIKLILGEGEPLVGRVLRYDSWQARFEEEVYQRVPACFGCAG